MAALKKFILFYLQSGKLVLLSISLISFAALATAFISEGFLGLEPCQLCIYQRIPYAVALVLGAIGAFAGYKGYLGGVIQGGIERIFLVLISLDFLVNSGIAFFHTGVERHWWESTESCKLEVFENDSQSFIENILSKPGGRCDQIPWADPVLGLSMANYNVIICMALSVLCLVSFIITGKSKGKNMAG